MSSLNEELKAIQHQVEKEHPFIEQLLAEAGKRIIGQTNMMERLLLGLLTGGHILLEGVPGLAKTLAVRTLAELVDADFQRIQFTPDLLPSDLLGTLVYNQKSGAFETKKGPVFSNLILADEINRAPAKVQSALLEAMQERQVTLGDETYPLPSPFLVLATQNPIEQEGTYPLPEAQVDRFMLKVLVGYPDKQEEKQIVRRMGDDTLVAVKHVLNTKRIESLRQTVAKIYMDESIADHIVDLVFASRDPGSHGIDPGLIAFGASPRASIYLARASRGHAFLRGRAFVTPEDVRAIGVDVLRHRIIPSYEAEAEGVSSEDLVERIFDHVKVP